MIHVITSYLIDSGGRKSGIRQRYFADENKAAAEYDKLVQKEATLTALPVIGPINQTDPATAEHVVTTTIVYPDGTMFRALLKEHELE